MPSTVDPNSQTSELPIVFNPNDTAVLIAKAAEEKRRELGILARIHATQLPTNVRELEEFLVSIGEGRWLKYSVTHGKYVSVPEQELERMSDPHHYALQGPISEQKDGTKDYYLFRKKV
jgi:hypothetical protein